MNPKISIISATLLLSSCAPMITVLPTALPAASATVATKIEASAFSPTPVSTLLVDPFQIPTPINTSHPVPTALNPDSTQDPSDLYSARVKGFENTLDFKITISGVGFEMQGVSDYIVYVEGLLTNISGKPIVVRRTLSSGHTYNEDVNWNISYNGKRLNCPKLYYDSFPDLSADDFVTLQPSEFQKYLLGFALPFEMPDDEGQDIRLSNKRIEITAKYFGFNVGYRDERFSYVDMNAWVGLVESNSVEYIFP